MTRFENRAVSVIVALGSIVASYSGAMASGHFTYAAGIEIYTPLQVEETSQLDFGVIIKPEEAVVVHVTPDGDIGASDTADHVGNSGVSAGQYRILGSEDVSLSIQASDAGGAPGLQFVGIEGKYDDGEPVDLMTGAGNLIPPGAEGTVLALGAALSVQPTVASGTYTPAFNLEMHYD